MNNFNDPNNVLGMTGILADDGEDLDIESIELSITQGLDFRKREAPDIVADYSQEIKQLEQQFSPDYADAAPAEYAMGPTPTTYTVEEESEDEDEDEESESGEPEPSRDKQSWHSSRPEDQQLGRMTNEERRQSHINNVLVDVSTADQDNQFLEQEDAEDEMARVLEQIDLLRTNLEADGVDLGRIQDVDSDTPSGEAKRVLRILQIKNDRARYCDMFEEGILACAYGLESVFDGRKEWFGTKIDLVGYSDTVKVKLRRMRYDTSSFVSGVVQGYAIGHGWRIIFELLPSLFLYSRDRRMRTNDNLVSDSSYKDALHKLHDDV